MGAKEEEGIERGLEGWNRARERTKGYQPREMAQFSRPHFIGGHHLRHFS